MDPKKTKPVDQGMDTIPESQVEEAFSIDEALNKKGFAEFVALHDDSESILQDEKRAEEVLTIFEKKDKIIEFSRKILSEQIGKEIGVDKGLELTRDDLDSVDDFLSKMAIEDSKGFLELVAKVDCFEADTREIKWSEHRLKTLGVDVSEGIDAGAIDSSRAELTSKMGVLQGVKGSGYIDSSMNTFSKWIGVRSVFLNGSLSANRTAAQEKYGLEKDKLGRFKNVDEEIGATQGLIDNLDQQIAVMEGLAELQEAKKSLVRDIFPGSALEPVIQAKVSEYLSRMALSTKLEELEKAHAFLEKARLASEESAIGANYVGAIDETEAQQTIDVGMASAVALKVGEAINRSTLGDKALARLEKSIKSFIERENLGSKDKDGYKDFLVKTLEDQITTLPPKPDSKAKAVLIKRIIIKINNA